MKRVRYSRWDGSQAEFVLDADTVLDALGELMLQGLSADQSLHYLRRHGFSLAGQDFRVMGSQELMRELASQARDLYRQHDLQRAFDEPTERLERALEWENQTLREGHGYESRAMNDFLERRHRDARRLSDRIAAFDDYEFLDPRAAREFAALRDELERIVALERFSERHAERFQGARPLPYAQAQQVRDRIESIERILQQLRAGDLSAVDPDELSRQLTDQAGRSLLILRDVEAALRDRGYLRDAGERKELTPRAVRRIGAQALASVYDVLRKGRPGRHATTARGASTPRPDESRAYEFGDALDIDVTRSVLNACRRAAGASGAGGRGPQVRLEDLEVHEQDFTTQTTTVLLLDLSWSMSFEGRFPAAKRVALAMDQLIRTRFPRDHFFIVGFSTRARQLQVRELPEISWDPADPFTNLQEGLMVAERLIVQHPSPTPQILVITDGQPTAYHEGNELHVEWPNGYGGISPHAVAQTLRQVQRVTRRGITINTFMLHDSPELVGFVERMTEINRGRALFTDPANLGSYVMVDHITRRRALSR